jgi:hypothetical protein
MRHCPATAGRTRFDIGDIGRRHRAELEAEGALNLGQRRVLSAIALCRTAALGGHVDTCRSCGYEEPAYNSCRNRHCPKCGWAAQERWIAARSARTLPVRHFHVVFTLPSELRALARFRPKVIYDALFHAASQTLLQLGRSRLRADLGITMVLHTWTRELLIHPHVHAIVTAGGLSLDGSRWIDSKRRFLFHVNVMGQLFRGKMLDALRVLHARDAFACFDDFRDPMAFDMLLAGLARHAWVVYAKEPFRRSNHVLQYLGRYTHRVAISNSRLVAVSDDLVTFKTKGRLTVTLTPLEFLRRLVLHVLPQRFVKIRHYGLAAGCNIDRKLKRARELLEHRGRTRIIEYTPLLPDLRAELLQRDCPICGGLMVRNHLPQPRSPPGSPA